MNNLIIEDYDFLYDSETKEYKLKSSEREVEGQGDLLQGLNELINHNLDYDELDKKLYQYLHAKDPNTINIILRWLKDRLPKPNYITYIDVDNSTIPYIYIFLGKYSTQLNKLYPEECKLFREHKAGVWEYSDKITKIRCRDKIYNFDNKTEMLYRVI